MSNRPKWFMPVAVVALLWNAMGCMAYLSDVRMGPEDVAKLSAAQQALYQARPSWAIAATAFAVWFGALGSLGLILKKGWAQAALLVSLLGVIAQDLNFAGQLDAIRQSDSAALPLQGLVLLIAVTLWLLARKARREGWVS
jgi:hypothetical protein